MNYEIYELIKKYGKMMMEQGYPVGEAQLILETDKGFFATRKGAAIDRLAPGDIEELEVKNLPGGEGDMKALVISQTPFCQRCLAEDRSFPAVLDDTAQIIGPEVVIVDGTGSQASVAKSLSKVMKQAAGCLVRTGKSKDGLSQGCTITMGRNLYEAVVAMTVLEKAAEVELKAEVLGGGVPLDPVDAAQMRVFYKNSYSKKEQDLKTEELAGAGETAENAGTVSGTADADASGTAAAASRTDTAAGTAAAAASGIAADTAATSAAAADTAAMSAKERDLRQLLVDYGKKLVETGLVQGTWGNLSVRLDHRYMLTTPSGLDYTRLTGEDMVKVEIESLKYQGSLKPTSEKGLHGAVYRRRPEIEAVIHTHSKYCTMFAAAHKALPIPEGQGRAIFGESVKVADYGAPGSDTLMKNTVDALGDSYGCTMANHGMMAVGKDLEEAFRNCSLLEEYGRQYIDSRFR